MQQDYFAQLQSWGISGGWEGITREEMHALLHAKLQNSGDPQPTTDEIAQWKQVEIANRFFGYVLTLNLTEVEREKVTRLRTSFDYRRLTDQDVEWVAGLIWRYRGPIYLHAILARFWQDRALYKRDAWYFTRASSAWRHAKEPHRALSCLDEISTSADNELLSAKHNCRAAALGDLDEMPAARGEALHAIKLNDKKAYAYNTLGAIYYKQLDFGSGDYYFAKAEELPGNQNRTNDLHGIMASMKPDDQQALAAHLLGLDPKKYRSFSGYLKR